MKTNKGFAPLVVLLIILGVLTVSGGAYFVGKSSAPKDVETFNDNSNYYPPVDQNQNSNTTVNNNPPTNNTTAAQNNVAPVTTSLNITFPTAGATLVEGQTYNVTWIGGSNSSNTYSVSFENEIGTIGIGQVSNLKKSISWTIPYLESYGERKVLPGDGFRIRIFPIGKYPQELYYSPVFKIVSPVKKAYMDSYKIIKPNLYIYGSGLASVKVYGVPTGTEVTQANVLGNATLQSTTNGKQTWVFQPREEQLLLTSMYLEGFDAEGKVVGKLDLPFNGAGDVYGAFY